MTNCDIIKDLIPLHCEGLCSEESEKLIAEHISTCDTCRMLCGQPSAPTPVNIPEKGETFKKVNRKMKRMTWKTWTIGILLVIIVGVTGFLFYGQKTKLPGTQSFETIIQNIEVRKIAGYIANGDMDAYVETISDDTLDVYNIKFFNDYRKICKRYLTEAYADSLGDTKPADIKVDSYYTYYDFIDERKSNVLTNEVQITFENGKVLEFSMCKNFDGRYQLEYVSGDGFEGFEDRELENAIILANYQDSVYNYIFSKRFFRIDEELALDIAQKFAGEYRQGFIDAQNNFLSGGYTPINMTFSRAKFDAEKELLYYTVSIEAGDDKGTAAVITRLYVDHHGYIPPAEDEVTVYENGCTPELANALKHYFG